MLFRSQKIKEGRESSLSLIADKLSSRAIADAAKAGDSLAKEAFEYAGVFLGQAIAGLLHLFNPTILVLGGGVMNSGDLIMHPIKRIIDESVMSPAYTKDLQIRKASLGEQAGLVGALVLARG